jgi:hypothetical protein
MITAHHKYLGNLKATLMSKSSVIANSANTQSSIVNDDQNSSITQPAGVTLDDAAHTTWTKPAPDSLKYKGISSQCKLYPF